MALQKQIERSENQVRGLFPQGYHRITEVTLDQETDLVRVKIKGFADEAARRYDEQGHQRLSETWLEVAAPETTPDDIIAWAYTAIKADSRYTDATDC